MPDLSSFLKIYTILLTWAICLKVFFCIRNNSLPDHLSGERHIWKVFNPRWVPKVLPQQNFFFAKVAYRLTWPQRKNFGVGVRTMGPESAKMVQISGFRGFWIYPFLTKIPFAGSGSVGAGQNFRKNKTWHIALQSKKKIIEKFQKLAELQKLQNGHFFSGHGTPCTRGLSPSLVLTVTSTHRH